MQLPPLSALRGRFEFVSVLGNPGYRRYYIGMMASVLSQQMLLNFSLIYLIDDLTNDTRYLGYVGAAVAVPSIGLNIFGGVFADKLNPKRLVSLAQGFSAIQITILGLLTWAGRVEPWHIILASVLFGAAQAFDTPSRMSIFPRLLDRKDLGQAVALNSFLWSASRVVAPAVAGSLVGSIGVAPSIFMGAAGFLCMAVLIQTVHPAPAERAKGRVIREMLMGFAFIRDRGIFLSLVSLSYFSSFFGMSYIILMPAFAREVLEVGPDRLGWLLASTGGGGVVGIFTAANLRNVQQRGLVILAAAAGSGTFLVLFALSTWFWASVPLTFLTGLFGSMFMVFVLTTLQTLVPNEYRGRVMGVHAITHSMGPLGALLLGFISAYTNPQFAIGLGGSLIILFVVSMGFGTRQVRSLTAAPVVAG